MKKTTLIIIIFSIKVPIHAMQRETPHQYTPRGLLPRACSGIARICYRTCAGAASYAISYCPEQLRPQVLAKSAQEALMDRIIGASTTEALARLIQEIEETRHLQAELLQQQQELRITLALIIAQQEAILTNQKTLAAAQGTPLPSPLPIAQTPITQPEQTSLILHIPGMRLAKGILSYIW